MYDRIKLQAVNKLDFVIDVFIIQSQSHNMGI